jgi:hypothetical protein
MGGRAREDAQAIKPAVQSRAGSQWTLWLGLVTLATVVVGAAIWLATMFAGRGTAMTAATPGRGPVIAWSYPTNLDPNGDYWLALRSEPSGASGVRVAKLGPDTLFVVTGSRGAWSQVRLADGRTGWVFSRYVGCCRSAAGP